MYISKYIPPQRTCIYNDRKIEFVLFVSMFAFLWLCLNVVGCYQFKSICRMVCQASLCVCVCVVCVCVCGCVCVCVWCVCVVCFERVLSGLPSIGWHVTCQSQHAALFKPGLFVSVTQLPTNSQFYSSFPLPPFLSLPPSLLHSV